MGEQRKDQSTLAPQPEQHPSQHTTVQDYINPSQSSQGPVQHQLQHHRMLASIELHYCAGELNHSKVECHAKQHKEVLQDSAIESCELRARRAAYINCSPFTPQSR